MTQPEILYEDAQLIVCYKPAGIATQTKKLGQKDMVSILLNHIAQEGTGQPFIGPAGGRRDGVCKNKTGGSKIVGTDERPFLREKILCQSTAYGRKNFCGSYRSCHRGNAAGLDAV